MSEMSASMSKQPGIVRFIGIDWNIGALKEASAQYWTFVALIGVFMVLGFGAWLSIITHGGAVVAMRDGYPWGLWFTNYMYYVGLSAGGLVVYASVHLFGAEHFRPLSKIAVLQAGVLTIMALLSILTDMERPLRIVWFLMTPNVTAPFIYTGSAVGGYMVLCFADLWVMITGKGGEKAALGMTLVALPFAIYLHSTTAWVLALNKSRELWNAAFMVPLFLTSATASGISLLFIFAYIFGKVTKVTFKPSMFRKLATLLTTVIALDLFMLLVEIVTVYWPTSAKPGHTIRFAEFFTGTYAWAFIPVIVLGVGAFILLARRSTRHVPAIQLTAAVMYVIAIFLKRYVLMAMGFVYNPIGQKMGLYLPSTTELLLSWGIIALGLFIVTLAIKVLPLEAPEHEHGHGGPDVRPPLETVPEYGVTP
jgi:dimethyl sulfoxide reductase membrane subunit